MQFKKIISATVLASLLAPQVCLAEDKVPSPEKESISHAIPPVKLQPGEVDPGKALSPMKKGQKAPFTGVLMSPAAVAETIVDIEGVEERIHIEITRAVQAEQAGCEKKLSDLDARLTADNKVLKASVDGKTRQINILNVELEKAQSMSRNRYLWGGLGFAGGVLISVLGVYAVSQVTK